MIITCPHCQTKYQVTYDAIGAAGRKVQCAHCQRAWQQAPLPAETGDGSDRLFEEMAEDALDDLMAAEERAVAARLAERAERERKVAQQEALGAFDPAEMQKRQKAFSRRQNAMFSRLPLARLRRAARITAALLLVGSLGVMYFSRVQIVERYPDLAGLYESVGLGVNVVGLDFSNLETLRALSDGKDVLTVSAQIGGLMPEPVWVPPVVISLLDAEGQAVYEWSVAPRVRDLMAGERASFDTRLSLPPSEAVRVRLSFAGGSSTQPEAGSLPAEPQL